MACTSGTYLNPPCTERAQYNYQLCMHADIDECFQAALLSIDLCGNVTNSQCVNSEGSFDCNCAPSYSMTNDGTCLSKLLHYYIHLAL